MQIIPTWAVLLSLDFGTNLLAFRDCALLERKVIFSSVFLRISLLMGIYSVGIILLISWVNTYDKVTVSKANKKSVSWYLIPQLKFSGLYIYLSV